VRKVLRISSNSNDEENYKVWDPLLGEIKFKNQENSEATYSEFNIQINVKTLIPLKFDAKLQE
jgi:hypothetical protein